MNRPSIVWRNHKKIQQYLCKNGKLLVWTKIFAPPLGFEDSVPYFSGIVELDSGERLPLQIVDCEEKDLKPNLKIVTIVRRGRKVKADEVIEYVIKARPLNRND